MARAKISIIGAGKVGSTLAQLLAYKELGDIVLWNRTAGKAQGVALDIEESALIEQFDLKIKGTGDYSDIKDSDVVIITAGVPRKEGMSREDLLAVNAEVIKSTCAQVKRYAPNCVLIVMTNPLDSMVYLAKKVTGFPKNRVVGQAGVLDSSRFSYFVATELGRAVEQVSSVVLGGHGDFMVPLPRYTSVAGIPVTELMQKKKIDALVARTRDAGAEIIKLEKDSSAFYAPDYSLVRMVESILKDKKMILPCAAYLDGEYGIKGIFMGVPVVLGAKGAEKIVELELNKGEKRLLMESAAKVKDSLKQLM